jgi:hypothetical protein
MTLINARRDVGWAGNFLPVEKIALVLNEAAICILRQVFVAEL